MKATLTILFLTLTQAAHAGDAYLCNDEHGYPMGVISIQDQKAVLYNWGGHNEPNEHVLTVNDDKEIRFDHDGQKHEIILSRLDPDRFAYSFIEIDPSHTRICSKMKPEDFTAYAAAHPLVKPVPPKLLVGVYDNCGYCGRHENQNKSCEINDQGQVTIEFSKNHDGVHFESKTSFRLEAVELASLEDLVSRSRGGTVQGKAQTYAGDAPSFSVTAYPETSDEFDVALYSDGSEVIESHPARKLAREAAKICGMNKKRLLWKFVLSKIGM